MWPFGSYAKYCQDVDYAIFVTPGKHTIENLALINDIVQHCLQKSTCALD